MHPAPSDEEILAILAEHRLPSGMVEASPHEGSVNHVRMVGELCVRVLKEEDFASDVYTEAAAVPALMGAGVRTPVLWAFDASRKVVPGIATIYERVPGRPLGLCGPFVGITGVVQELGEQIARWRDKVRWVADPNGWLDRPRGDNVWGCYERAAERLSRAERAWTEATIRRLEAAPEPEPEFVHWDLHAFNLLVNEGALTAVLDWGDAGFGDPTLNYRCLPAHWLPVLLSSYAEDQGFVGRCLYHMLGYALNDVYRAPRYPGPYDHTGHRRWESLMALAAGPPRPPWREWLGDPPGQ